MICDFPCDSCIYEYYCTVKNCDDCPNKSEGDTSAK